MAQFNTILLLVMLITTEGISQNANIDTTVVKNPVIPASFEGGIRGFYAYIGQNINYPRDAFKKGIQGKVYVEFTIESTGNVVQESIKILKEVHSSLEQEAIRIIQNSPKWIPARQHANGPPVSSNMVIPIIFKVESKPIKKKKNKKQKENAP